MAEKRKVLADFIELQINSRRLTEELLKECYCLSVSACHHWSASCNYFISEGLVTDNAVMAHRLLKATN
jgi:hypothetical protein